MKADIPPSFDPEYADFSLLSDGLKQIAFRRQRYVLAVLQRTSKLSRPVVKRIVWDVMREIGDDKPPSYSSICRWVEKWTASHDIRGLVPDFHARGSKDPKLDIESIEIMMEVINESWLGKPRQTRQTIYELVAKRIQDENLGRPEHEKLDMPSERTIRREIARLDRKEVMAARYGSKEANEAFHQVMMLETVDRPNQRVEIDDTPLDIIVVDSLYRTPLGRPYLTVTIDTYSRMITGFVVTFSPPSADTVMLCVRHAILDKSYVAEKYLSIKNKWIACGKMDELVSDHHSSFKHHGLEDALAGLNIVQHFAPKGRSWLRPHVEGFFRTVGVNLLHQMPGTTYSNIVKRGRENPAKSAAFTLDEFIYLMHLWVMRDWMRRRQVRLIVVDEVQHLIERPIAIQNAANWLKVFLDESNVPGR